MKIDGIAERDPIWTAKIKNRAAIKDVAIEAPRGSGFGLEPEWSLIDQYRL